MEEISIYNKYWDKTFKYKVIRKNKRIIDFLVWCYYPGDWIEERLFKNKHGVWCVSNTNNSKTMKGRRWWVIATNHYIQLVDHLTSEAS